MSVGFYEDFGRAVDTARKAPRLQLQKKMSAIYELFKPKESQAGNSTHEVYLGPVEYQSASNEDVWPETPMVQHPSLSTRSNKLNRSKILVGVPRKVAQTRGLNIPKLAASFTTLIEAAKYRNVEGQLTSLLSDEFALNPIMDGLNEGPSTAPFPLANNRTGQFGGAGQLHFLDLMEARQELANVQGNSLTMTQMGKMGAARTLDDLNYIVFCSNKAWFTFIAQNRNYFFNQDNSTHYTAAFEKDGFKVNIVQDMAIITTAQDIQNVDAFGTKSSKGFTSNVGVASGGTVLPNASPVYIMPRGGFEMQRPVTDDHPLSLKEIATNSFEKALYGECNVYGQRIYDELVLRYWVNENDTTAIV